MDFNMFMTKMKEWQSQPHMFIVNMSRMKEMEAAYDILKEIVYKYDPDVTMEVNTNVINDGSASISIETCDLVVHDVKEFIEAIKKANNFEIYPLKNGNLRIAIMFNDIMKVIK